MAIDMASPQQPTARTTWFSTAAQTAGINMPLSRAQVMYIDMASSGSMDHRLKPRLLMAAQIIDISMVPTWFQQAARITDIMMASSGSTDHQQLHGLQQ